MKEIQVFSRNFNENNNKQTNKKTLCFEYKTCQTHLICSTNADADVKIHVQSSIVDVATILTHNKRI